ncbi:unnamed protein product [Effrenium voratum]|uniref:Uncharacterized protein n=1 Tax=Effrenium voratum TaxID=2562239 RepID=A0AA36MU47_9DINO|nr:unnamed protein product [Effrenium voratum]
MQAMLGGMPPGTAPAADGSVPPFDPATAAAYMQMMQCAAVAVWQACSHGGM